MRINILIPYILHELEYAGVAKLEVTAALCFTPLSTLSSTPSLRVSSDACCMSKATLKLCQHVIAASFCA